MSTNEERLEELQQEGMKQLEYIVDPFLHEGSVIKLIEEISGILDFEVFEIDWEAIIDELSLATAESNVEELIRILQKLKDFCEED